MGTSVPDGFTLPWNTTRTLGDVWRNADRDQRRRDRELVTELADGAPQVPVTPSGKIAFAGYDKTETQFRSR